MYLKYIFFEIIKWMNKKRNSYSMNIQETTHHSSHLKWDKSYDWSCIIGAWFKFFRIFYIYSHLQVKTIYFFLPNSLLIVNSFALLCSIQIPHSKCNTTSLTQWPDFWSISRRKKKKATTLSYTEPVPTSRRPLQGRGEEFSHFWSTLTEQCERTWGSKELACLCGVPLARFSFS